MGAGPARERERSSRQDARDLFISLFWSSVSETRGNGGAFRDRSSHPWALSFGHPWPNRSLQAPPLPRSLCSGTATGQKTARTFLRSGVCGGESSKERRDRVGFLERGLWHPAGWLKPPFRGRGPLPQGPGSAVTPCRRPVVQGPLRPGGRQRLPLLPSAPRALPA